MPDLRVRVRQATCPASARSLVRLVLMCGSDVHASPPPNCEPGSRGNCAR
ncbi:hypothetical protein LHK_00645 [Laribacter hongkongensis HLHK9]|uniref:Uncharacterized protein n=1 Tax=Laribacter hongkongensis (strain HLHK9) TaxID=557598 RepID=C1DD03_LARHH|nr:hypothetical protein LHK_00645 [Laribacter hongkongensis HLHK9]